MQEHKCIIFITRITHQAISIFLSNLIHSIRNRITYFSITKINLACPHLLWESGAKRAHRPIRSIHPYLAHLLAVCIFYIHIYEGPTGICVCARKDSALRCDFEASQLQPVKFMAGVRFSVSIYFHFYFIMRHLEQTEFTLHRFNIKSSDYRYHILICS